jgi:hypothetical protein
MLTIKALSRAVSLYMKFCTRSPPPTGSRSKPSHVSKLKALASCRLSWFGLCPGFGTVGFIPHKTSRKRMMEARIIHGAICPPDYVHTREYSIPWSIDTLLPIDIGVDVLMCVTRCFDTNLDSKAAREQNPLGWAR